MAPRRTQQQRLDVANRAAGVTMTRERMTSINDQAAIDCGCTVHAPVVSTARDGSITMTISACASRDIRAALHRRLSTKPITTEETIRIQSVVNALIAANIAADRR